MELTHLDSNGNAIMVDVSEKEPTKRTAVGFASVRMAEETLRSIMNGSLKKGDALAVARIAGITAAKRTFELIPLCHNIPIESVKIDFENNGTDHLFIYSTLKCSYKTGIEMEALTAASVAALTVYDMCKAIDRAMVIEEVKLIKKTGGKSDYYEGSVRQRD